MIDTIDYENSSKELMLSQFDNSPIAQSLLYSWVTPLSSLETDLQSYMEFNGVSTAYGKVLEIIGEYLDVSRDGRLDEEYRQAILARGLLEDADGTTEKFLKGMRVLCNSSVVTFHEYYPATVYAHAGEGATISTLQELRRIAPAGVHVRLMVDVGLKSFQLSEVLDADNNLVTGDGDDYEVDIDGVTYQLITSENSGETLSEDGNFLAELFDTEFTPLCDVVASELVNVSYDLVTSNGNTVVDNNGNAFILIDIG